jgi:single-strand DNA-binding protein
MNRVTLVGRLAADPELRVTAAGRAVASFTVVTASASGSEYHPAVAYDEVAEQIARHFSTRSRIALEGRLCTRSWDGADGQRHWRTEVVAEAAERISGRAAA